MQRRGLPARHAKNMIDSGPRKHFRDEISDMSPRLRHMYFLL